MKREKDRIYLPAKDLVTSGGLMKNLAVKVENGNSLHEIVRDDLLIKREVGRLNEAGQIYRTIL